MIEYSNVFRFYIINISINTLLPVLLAVVLVIKGKWSR